MTLAGLCSGCDRMSQQIGRLTAERDALQCQLVDLEAEGSHLATRMAILERDAVTVHRDLRNEALKLANNQNEELIADNVRLLAEVAHWKDLAQDRVTEAEDNLAELREAAEAVHKIYADGRQRPALTRLGAVLAKVKP